MNDSFSIKGLIESSPGLGSGTIDYDHHWTVGFGGVLNIYGNLSEEDVLRIANYKSQIGHVQFARKFYVHENTLRNLNDTVFLSDKLIHLRETFNGFGAFDDLQHLMHLPNLKSYGFSSFQKIDLSPIKEYVELTNFGLGGYNISLKAIEGYKHFKSFGLGDKIKDFKIISSFINLENLGISSQNLKNLDFILPLKNLRKISFSLGSTVAFDDLVLLESLEELGIWRTKQLEIEHLIPLNKITNLKILKLQELPRITNFSWLDNSSVTTLVIENLKGLKTYESLKHNQHIKTLVIKDGRLDRDKILSIGKLNNIEDIQVYKWYLENKSDSFSILPNYDKIKEMELKYLL